jgi:predicted patatin/cPLA2 family phospholipase
VDSDRVVDNIRTRKAEIAEGRDSPIKTGLVIQGGAMRGIYSMAALMALGECGLGDAFDHVVGSSAGAVNGAYLVSRQARLAVGVYLENISNKRFVDFTRFRRVVDIDYLIDDVLKTEKILDIEALRQSKSVLHVVLTDYDTATATSVTSRDDDLDIMEAMRATMAIPILFNKKVKVKGRYYVDGGITEGVPLLRAIDLGCTDIIVVLTRNPSFRRKRPNVLFRLIETPFLRDYPAVTKAKIMAKDEYFNKTMEYLQRPGKLVKEASIKVIYPSDLNKMVSRTTNARERLLEYARMGRNDCRRAIGEQALDDTPF